MKQADLFPNFPSLPHGLHYRENFITQLEEQQLLAFIASLPLAEAKYKEYTARRRTYHYGSGYDFGTNVAIPAPPIPEALFPLRARVAEWAGMSAASFVQALVAEYQPGTPLGWHRDVPDFEVITGISLAGAARMRFRPYPWRAERKREIFALELQPRSAYILRGAARWEWQHSVPPVTVLRYSLTFRTRRN